MLNYNEPEIPNLIDYSKDKWELKISYDEIADSPRSWDNLGTICVSRACRYVSNEATALADSDVLEWCDAEIDKKALEDRGYIVLPLSVYDHSGVSFYIGGKRDRWDSGQIGWYIASKDDIRKAYNVKRITNRILEKAKHLMESEIQTFNAYVNGQVYEFTLYHNGDEVDSCGGFYDDDNEYKGFIKYMYDCFPKEFTDSFTVEQTKEMAECPWE
jgi:hypothetical protein